MMSTKYSATVAMKLTQEMKTQLVATAEREDRTVSAVCRRALRYYLSATQNEDPGGTQQAD